MSIEERRDYLKALIANPPLGFISLKTLPIAWIERNMHPSLQHGAGYHYELKCQPCIDLETIKDFMLKLEAESYEIKIISKKL